MSGWWLHLLFPVACFVPGFLWLALVTGRPASGERLLSAFLFRRVVAGFLFHSAVAFILMEIGLLTPWWLLGVEGILCLLLLVGVWWRRKHLHWPKPSWEDLLPLFLLLVAGLSFGRPHVAIQGGKDPGSYIGTAATIARTGTLRISDPIWAAMDPDLAQEELLFASMPGLEGRGHRLPGFYAVDHRSGTVLPQFYHLYPLWLGLGFLLTGFPGGLFMTPVLAAWGVVAIYQAGRVIIRKWPALLAGLLLCLNPLVLWMARRPLSEIPAQLLLFGALYGLVVFLTSEGHDRAAAILAGAAMGGLLHTRPDSILAVALVGLWLLFRLATTGRPRFTLAPLLLPLGLSLAHWIPYQVLFAWDYTRGAVGGSLRFLFSEVVWPIGLLGAGVFFLLVLAARRGRLGQRLPALRLATVAVVLLLVGFAWFIWPRLSPPEEVGFFNWRGWTYHTTTQSHNFLQLTWYLTPLGVALGVTGFCLALLREEIGRIGYLAGLTLPYGFLYTYHNAGHPIHPHAMRRQIMVLIPVLMLMAIYGLQYLFQQRQWTARLTASAMLTFLLVSFVTPQPIWRQVDFAGIEDEMAALAGRFAPSDVLLFTDLWPGIEIAVPLQYLYQRPSFVLQNPQPASEGLQGQVEAWEQEGRDVFVLVGQGGSRLSPEAFSLEWLGPARIRWKQLEYPLDRRPEQVVEKEIFLNVYRLEVRGEDMPPEIDIGGPDYPYLREGFWGAGQTPQGQTFRWTKEEALIELPGQWWDTPGPLTLTLTLGQNWASPERPSTVEIRLEETLLGRFTPSPAFQDYSFPIPEELRERLSQLGIVLLELRSTTFVPATAGREDQRELGVALDRVALERPR